MRRGRGLPLPRVLQARCGRGRVWGLGGGRTLPPAIGREVVAEGSCRAVARGEEHVGQGPRSDGVHVLGLWGGAGAGLVNVKLGGMRAGRGTGELRPNRGGGGRGWQQVGKGAPPRTAHRPNNRSPPRTAHTAPYRSPQMTGVGCCTVCLRVGAVPHCSSAQCHQRGP